MQVDDPYSETEASLHQEIEGDLLPPESSPEPSAPRFSIVLNIFAALVVVAYFTAGLWYGWVVPRLDRVQDPAESLELIASRTMDLEGALNRAPDWEQDLYAVFTGSESELDLMIRWYHELASVSSRPLPQLYLSILEAEADNLDRVRERIEGWRGRVAPFPLFIRLIEASYFSAPLDSQAELELQAGLAEELPAGWFYDQLAIRLATRGGNQALRADRSDASLSRGSTLLEHTRRFLVIDLSMLGVGTVILVFVLAGRSGAVNLIRVGDASQPPPWNGWVGAVVLVRGGAAYALIEFALAMVSPAEEFLTLRVLSLPVMYLPLLWLAYKYLCRPSGTSFNEALGLKIVPGRLPHLVSAVLALSAAGLLGDWILVMTAQSWGLAIHWTDWFDPQLVWGTNLAVATTMIEYGFYAPVFEELVFRGILFAAFRRQFGMWTSATLSASIFALGHGYGLLGLVSVWWSGMVWAWGYEKTGSILPGVICHSVGNLLVGYSLLVFLRG